MKKSTRGKNTNQKKKVVSQAHTSEVANQSKRKTLSIFRKSIFGLIFTGGASAYFYNAYQSDLEERDLTKIGRGKPTIVQIHDPNCPICNALQKTTRSALSNIEDDKIEYLVANIRTNEGREFAAKHKVPHVTLLLFNKRGQLQNILQGVRQEDELTNIFKDLATN